MDWRVVSHLAIVYINQSQYAVGPHASVSDNTGARLTSADLRGQIKNKCTVSICVQWRVVELLNYLGEVDYCVQAEDHQAS